MKILHGWIFHVYASGLDTVVRVVDAAGQVYQLLDRFAPAFYIGGEPQECYDVARFILEQQWDVKLSRVDWSDPSLGQPVRVLCIEVENPCHFAAITQRVRYFRPKLTYYHHDLSLPELYLQARQIPPLTLCQFAVDKENRILGIECCTAITCREVRDEVAASTIGESTEDKVSYQGVNQNTRPEFGPGRSAIRARRTSVVTRLEPRREI